MKKTAIIATLILSMVVVFIGCKDKRDTGRAYIMKVMQAVTHLFLQQTQMMPAIKYFITTCLLQEL
jgi:hypothetical protein